MTDTLITTNQNSAIAEPLTVGQIANEVAAKHAFDDYRSCKAKNTIARQDNDLNLFAEYLTEVGAPPIGSLATDPEAWEGITWGLVSGFIKWQLYQGFAVSSVNVRLSTVKAYAKLAVKAGSLEETEYAMIRTVSGYSRKQGKRIDEQRQGAEVNTRFERPGAKKSEAVSLSGHQANKLKAQPDTAQGRRDALLMCLLLDHGLRCGEVAGLLITDFDLQAGELKFHRPKVYMVQTHRLTKDTLDAAKAYFEKDAPGIGPTLRGSRKGGHLTDNKMSERAITKRVATLGIPLGFWKVITKTDKDGEVVRNKAGEVVKVKVGTLSAHDCRHYWATTAAHNGTPIDRLQEAGGWSSPAMPLRYVEAAKIANDGVLL